jgi:hypothetical protein
MAEASVPITRIPELPLFFPLSDLLFILCPTRKVR